MKDLLSQLKSLPQDELDELMMDLGAFKSQALTTDIENACDIDLSGYEEYDNDVQVYIFPSK